MVPVNPLLMPLGFNCVPVGWKFKPPQGTVFVDAPQGEISVRLISGRDLVAADLNGSSDPYVKIRSQGFDKPVISKCIQKNLNPKWDQTMEVSVSQPTSDILHFEVYDKDALGKDDMIGYFGVDCALLPMGVEVVTSERLSYVPRGTIQVGITAINFGLQNYPAQYLADYTEFRGRIPAVSQKGMEKEAKKTKKEAKKSAVGKPPKEEGPYHDKSVHPFYEIVNGWLKKKKTKAAIAGGVAYSIAAGTGNVLLGTAKVVGGIGLAILTCDD
eukprot:gene19091-22863_t